MSRAAAVAAAVAVAALAGAGCIDLLPPCAGRAVSPGEHLECPTPGWTDRAFDLELPVSWDGSSPLPVVFAFHGGGGNRHAAATVACPGGDTRDPECFAVRALAAGYAVVRPDGTGTRPVRNVRTWNAGGGQDGFNCTSGPACRAGVDDLGYFDELFAEVGRTIPVDARRVYATGLSNGAAISHRLACQRPERFAAIAVLGGSNQWAGTGGACAAAVPLLHIHGTLDPCWGFEESTVSCAGGEDAGVKVGVDASMAGWATRNGCATTFVDEPLPDRDPSDGTTSTRRRWDGCAAATELITMTGAGHTWPRGYAYLGEARIGRVAQDFGSEVIVDFFRAHVRP